MSDQNQLTYAQLAAAGNEKYLFETHKKIDYPGTEVVMWHGFRRHNFELNGHTGFIVEPPHPAPGLPWSWCLQWAESFVPRTPALQLLNRGFHHVHFNVFDTYMNEEGIKAVEEFYALLQSLHFNPKAALIGMSYGGLFSLRWAEEHPETVGAVYLDAPVCDLAFAAKRIGNDHPLRYTTEAARHFAAYKVDDVEGLVNHPANPLNNYSRIAAARIPILALRNGQDQSVFPQSNIDVFEERLKSAGGNIQVINRDLYGHHPHGMDDPTALTSFILQHYPDFEI